MFRKECFDVIKHAHGNERILYDITAEMPCSCIVFRSYEYNFMERMSYNKTVTGLVFVCGVFDV